MKIFIASDLRATVCNGRIYLASQHFHIIKRYYEAFGPCTLCSRVMHQSMTDELLDATDIIDKLIEVKRLEQTFMPSFYRTIAHEIRDADLVIARLHSIIGMHVLRYAKKHGKKCFAEVMGDAWDALWNHSLRGKIIAPYAFLMTKKVVWNADYASYVTNEYLQKRYPCPNESLAASDVQPLEISDAVLQKRLERIRSFDSRNICLMTTGAVDVRYKGQEYVIKAIPALNKLGIHVKYMLVGGGDPTRLRHIAQTCGVEDQVMFLGRRPWKEVIELLDTADIYVQPSLQEGLPRSVVEAMSRGCPVIGTNTGGIPELLSSECVVPRKVPKELVYAMLRIANHKKISVLAKWNIEKSRRIRHPELDEERMTFFSAVVADIKKKRNHDQAVLRQ